MPSRMPATSHYILAESQCGKTQCVKEKTHPVEMHAGLDRGLGVLHLLKGRDRLGTEANRNKVFPNQGKDLVTGRHVFRERNQRIKLLDRKSVV